LVKIHSRVHKLKKNYLSTHFWALFFFSFIYCKYAKLVVHSTAFGAGKGNGSFARKMQEFRGEEVKIYSFFASALKGCITPMEMTSGTHRLEEQCDNRSGPGI
jgi:hypothetical protein